MEILTQACIKMEIATESHGHQFKVKFKKDDVEEYTVYCDKPRTVLEAIKTLKKSENSITDDKKIIIQMGKGDNKSLIATHFPCSFIEEDEVLTISCQKKLVEEINPGKQRVTFPRDRYSIFYISKDGGKNTISKPLFRNNAVKKFDYLLVYAQKGKTVKEALINDGRFLYFDFFELSENEDTITECTQKVNKMDNRKFKICLPVEHNNTPEEEELSQPEP